jgi:PAS domain S-box-containing protein
MSEFVDHAFSHDGFMPHGMCYLWQPGLLSLHVVSDAFIALAYATIPFALLYFVRQRRDLQFNWIFVCFAIFIIACGATHVMEIVTVWTPVYWLSGTVKAITAVASIPTAFLLVKLIPDAVRLPSPAALRREIEVRERAEADVRRANEDLEARVVLRTAQLEATNAKLNDEARLRHRVEESLRSSHQLLEAIADSASAVIYAKDPEGRYLLTSRRFDESFGLKRGEILGRTDETLFSPEIAETIRAFDQRVFAAESAIIEEEIIPHAGGAHVYLSMKSALRNAAGQAHAIFGMSMDITERKRDDERQRAELERLRLLERTTRAIGGCRDLPGIYAATLDRIEESFAVDLAVICEREGDNPLMTVARVGAKSQPLAEQLALLAQTKVGFNQDGFERCLTGELVYEPDLSTSISRFPERLARVGLRSLVIAPLITEGKVTGVLLCARRMAAGFSSSDCAFLELLTQHVSLAANHVQRYDSLLRATA